MPIFSTFGAVTARAFGLRNVIGGGARGQGSTTVVVPFTSSGTFTVPTGVSSIDFVLVY